MRQLLFISSILYAINLISAVDVYSNSFQLLDSLSSRNKIINYNDEDAYFIYNNTELEVINTNSEKKIGEQSEYAYALKIIFSYSYKMKINNRYGLENYAYLTFNNDETIIKSFEISTIKTNGTIIKFDSSQIFHSSIPLLDESKKNINLIKYVIPGVEVGDEIEVKYSTEYHGIFTPKLFGDVFFHTYLPSVKSDYKIIVPYPYKIFYKCYNGLIDPKIEYIETKAICNFSLDSISSIKDYNYTCLSNELPYFYYSIEYGKDIEKALKWKDFYNEFIFLTSLPLNYNDPYETKVKKWIKKNLKDHKGKNKYEQFELLYNKIKNDFKIVSSYQVGSFSQIDLFEGIIDHNILSVFYVKLLNYLQIEYNVCFCRDKYLGAIDDNFIRRNEITDYALLFYDNDSNSFLIYPHDVINKYCVGEYPSHLNGTDAIIVKQKSQNSKNKKKLNIVVEDDSLLVLKKIFIHRGNEKSNYYYRQRLIGVDLKKDESSYYSVINFSGFCSTDSRSFYNNLFSNKGNYNLFLSRIQKERDLFKIDSIYLSGESNKYPYRYSVSMSGQLGKFYNFINDSTIVISIKEILNSNKIEYNKRQRNTDILLPYTFSDIQELIIEFNQPVNLINKEILRKEYKNSLGSYKFEIIINNNKKIKLLSTYIIKNELIRKESFKDLDAINDASNEMSNSRIIIGLRSE